MNQVLTLSALCADMNFDIHPGRDSGRSLLSRITTLMATNSLIKLVYHISHARSRCADYYSHLGGLGNSRERSDVSYRPGTVRMGSSRKTHQRG